LEFIKDLRKYCNRKEITIRVMGRGSRKEYKKVAGSYAAQSGVSQKYAEWFAIYVYSGTETAYWRKHYHDNCNKDAEIKNLKEQNILLQKDIVHLANSSNSANHFVDSNEKTLLEEAKRKINDLNGQINSSLGIVIRMKQEKQELIDQNNNLKESLRIAMQGEILPDTSNLKGHIKITMFNGTTIEFNNPNC
jgi:hypothetical protein